MLRPACLGRLYVPLENLASMLISGLSSAPSSPSSGTSSTMDRYETGFSEAVCEVSGAALWGSKHGPTYRVAADPWISSTGWCLAVLHLCAPGWPDGSCADWTLESLHVELPLWRRTPRFLSLSPDEISRLIVGGMVGRRPGGSPYLKL